jgi:hypothetical protein
LTRCLILAQCRDREHPGGDGTQLNTIAGNRKGALRPPCRLSARRLKPTALREVRGRQIKAEIKRRWGLQSRSLPAALVIERLRLRLAQISGADRGCDGRSTGSHAAAQLVARFPRK